MFYAIKIWLTKLWRLVYPLPLMRVEFVYHNGSSLRFAPSRWDGVVTIVHERSDGYVEAFHTNERLVRDALARPSVTEQYNALHWLKKKETVTYDD